MLSSLLQKAGLRPGLALYSAIPKALMAAAMVGGAGSLLTAGSARAIDSCTFGIVGATCATGTLLDIGDKRVTFISAPSAGSGTVNFQNLVGDLFTVTVNFSPTLSVPIGSPITNATFKYDIEIVTGNQFFTGVKIDSTNPGGATTEVRKSEILGPNYFSELVSSNGLPDPGDGVSFEPIAGSLTKLTVTDTYSVTNPGSLLSFVNTYRQTEVPGPLPIMGAGIAFGFSRKLRSRIKSSASAKA